MMLTMPPITTIENKDLPERLRRSFSPPKKMYVRGKFPDLRDTTPETPDKPKVLAIVGARKYSPYGERACRELVAGLSGYPIIIVSGLAIGIDSISHEAALDAGLQTIAVPGSGLDEMAIYPQSKLGLAKKILKSGGCLISEYAPDVRAMPHMFPQRNRIMAALADAVLVIEAEMKSGTLITARMALDLNKDVFAVPASIFSSLAEGPNFLIKQGAATITCSRDIIEAVGLQWKENSGTENLFAECSEQERALLVLLPSSKDDLVQALGKPAQEIAMLVSLLEIKGLVEQRTGKITRFGE